MTPSVNLIPVPRRQLNQRRGRVSAWLAAIASYGVVLLAGYAVVMAASHTENDDTAAAVEKAANQGRELERSLATLRPQLTETQNRLAIARTVGDQPDWSQLLEIVGTTVDDEMVLTATRLDAAAPDALARLGPTTKPATGGDVQRLTLALHGFAKSQAAVSQYVLRLERLGLFDRVDLVSSGRQGYGTGEMTAFRVECMIHGGQKAK